MSYAEQRKASEGQMTQEMYYKATRPDGTDFYTGTVDYAALSGTGEYLPELPGGTCCGPGVYHASTSAADTLIGGSWPCRLFKVYGKPVAREGNKRGFKTLLVGEEMEAWKTLGPNGQEVETLIKQVGALTTAQIYGLADARREKWNALASRAAARGAAGEAARGAAWEAARDAAWEATWDAAWEAAGALVVRDLIGHHGFTQEHFDALYGPWREVMIEGRAGE